MRENQAQWQRREAACFDKPCLFDWYSQRGDQLTKFILSHTSTTERGKTCRPVYDGETLDAMRERYHEIVVSFASRHGETEQEFYHRVGSSPTDVEALSLAAENCGASIEGLLQSLDGFSNALKDPDKRKLLQCMRVDLHLSVGSGSVPLPGSPTVRECEELEKRLAPGGASR